MSISSVADYGCSCGCKALNPPKFPALEFLIKAAVRLLGCVGSGNPKAAVEDRVKEWHLSCGAGEADDFRCRCRAGSQHNTKVGLQASGPIGNPASVLYGSQVAFLPENIRHVFR
jgi:hypothetical protein